MAKRDNYRIVYLDETCFTRKTVQDTEWALPKQNLAIEVKMLDEPTLALLSGISKECGQEHFKIFEKSVTTQKFVEYLEELRHLNGTAKICLFMDNLSAHTAEDSKKKMKDLGFGASLTCPIHLSTTPSSSHSRR